MNEEEKQAIEILRNFEPDDLVECSIYIQAVEKITNLIDKQQKEIEELKKTRYILNAKTGEIKVIRNNFISKDKIKEKIEKIKEDEEFYRKRYRMYEFNGKINILEELLGE